MGAEGLSAKASVQEQAILSEVGSLKELELQLQFASRSNGLGYGVHQSCGLRPLSGKAGKLTAPKDRVLHLFVQLQRENQELRIENERLKSELDDVFALAQLILDCLPVDPSDASETLSMQLVPAGAAEAASRTDVVVVSGSELCSEGEAAEEPKLPQKCRTAGRATLLAYETLGAEAQDCSPTLKQKYRSEQLRLHPDKGGSHDDFLKLQCAADKLASKRASFAAAIGRAPVAAPETLREPPAGTDTELENGWLPWRTSG